MNQTLTQNLSPIFMDRLEKFSGKVNSLSTSFFVFDSEGKTVLNAPTSKFESDMDQIADCASRTFGLRSLQVHKFGHFDHILCMCLTEDDQIKAVAVIDTGREHLCREDSIVNFCRENNIAAEQLENIIDTVSHDTEYFSQMLASFNEQANYAATATQQLEMVSTELSQTYEELILLYNLSTNMKVTQSNATYLQMACDQLTQLVNVEGIAIFLEKDVDRQKKLILTAGSGVVVIDQIIADILQNCLAEELRKGKEALLDSNVYSPFRYEWPEGIKNIIAVPLNNSDKMTGFLVATNVLNKPDFDSTDIKLFTSVANQCAVFIDNNRLFHDLKELFIGSLKALTSSIDAKDQYTRGHSERVAFISRWIAEQMSPQENVDEQQIHRIYLAGLLHDIGKIGVSEVVLRKKGKLTDEEIAIIKSHSKIGASILSEIPQMRDIIPGVLYHHERIDGKGYPEGLKGEQIPLIGKIISLADAFDAMTSKRVYRDAMSLTKAVSEIKKGIGTQFDEKVAQVFIESDVKKLWKIIQDGFIESWDYSNFAEYGTIAVGSLIR